MKNKKYKKLLKKKKLKQKLLFNMKKNKLKLTHRKKILSRNITGLSFQQQKKLNKAVKNAKILGMYPFTMPLM